MSSYENRIAFMLLYAGNIQVAQHFVSFETIPFYKILVYSFMS